MALVYPGSAAIPQYQSSLAEFMPAFEAGQRERKDADAFAAAAKAFGGSSGTPAPQPQTALEKLMGMFGGGQQDGPYTRPQPTPQWAPTPTDIPESSWETVASIPTSGAAPGIPQGYIANARASESGGNDMAANPNSSALGRYQFLDSTWRGLMEQYPGLGLTADGRTDPAQQERAMAQFTQDNARALAGAGIPVDPGTLYAAHFLGAGGAQKALTADPSTPMSALVEPGVIRANPQLAQMTAGDFAQWAQRKGGNPNGGYQPPMQDVGAGQGQPFQMDEGTMRTLLASDATRPLAISLIQAQQQAQASQGRYVTEQGQDGSIWQRDTLTGERSVLQGPQEAPQRRIVQGPDGNDYYEDGTRVLPNVEAPAPAPDAPTTRTIFDEATGLEQTVQWDGSDWIPVGGVKAPTNGLTVTTNPDGTTTVQQGGTAKPLTEGQSKDTVYITRAQGALPILDQFGEALTDYRTEVTKDIPLVGNATKSPEYQQAEQAGLEFLQAILRKDTGAAITPAETAEYGKVYLPRPGDSPEVLAQKQQSRQRAVAAIAAGLPPQAILAAEQALLSSGSAPASPPAGVSDDLPQGVTEEDIEYTMQLHGLTREQVLERINAAP